VKPEQYVAQLAKLIASGRDREALEYSLRYRSMVSPGLSPEQFDRVSGMMEGAAMSVALSDAAAGVEAEAPARP
jgi:hypothetical protein